MKANTTDSGTAKNLAPDAVTVVDVVALIGICLTNLFECAVIHVAWDLLCCMLLAANANSNNNNEFGVAAAEEMTNDIPLRLDDALYASMEGLMRFDFLLLLSVRFRLDYFD